MEGKHQAILLLGTIFAIFGICNATTHTVGGSSGWIIPSSPSFYPSWAANQTFKVGDVLVFNFPAGAHTVAQVNKGNYDSCNTANTIGAVQTTAPAKITLTSAGTHYFICTIPTHCSNNQKLSVVVSAASSATSPASPPTTTPAASPTTPTGGVTAPAASPTTPSGGATTPAASPATSPSEGPSTPTAEGPSTPSAPAPSSATSTSVGLLSLVSLAFVALMF